MIQIIAAAVMLIAASLGLGGCADTGQPTKTTIVEVFADACHVYATALRSAARALDANVLSPAEVKQVDDAQAVGDHICKGPMPGDGASAVVTILDVTAQIVMLAGGGAG